MSRPATDAELAEAYRNLEGGIADAKDAAAVATEVFSRTFPSDDCGMAARVREKMPGLDADLQIFMVREETLAAFHYALVNARAEVRRLFDAYHAGFEATADEAKS